MEHSCCAPEQLQEQSGDCCIRSACFLGTADLCASAISKGIAVKIMSWSESGSVQSMRPHHSVICNMELFSKHCLMLSQLRLYWTRALCHTKSYNSYCLARKIATGVHLEASLLTLSCHKDATHVDLTACSLDCPSKSRQWESSTACHSTPRLSHLIHIS